MIRIEENASKDREKWLADRRSAIGASEVAGVLGISPWCTPWSIWADKTGRLNPEAENVAMSAGNRLEPAVLDEAESRLGKLVRDVRVVCDDIPLACTCDALTEDPRPIEGKTTGIVGPVYPSADSWGDEFTDEIPDYYLSQVLAQCIAVKSDLGHLFALIGGRGFVQYNVEATADQVEFLKTEVDKFWDYHIIGDREPDPEGTRLQDVKRLRVEPGKTTTFDFVDAAMVATWKAKKEEAAAMKKTADEAQAQILAALGDAELATLPDGSSVSNKQQTRKEHVVSASTFRVLRTKKAPKPKKTKAKK